MSTYTFNTSGVSSQDQINELKAKRDQALALAQKIKRAKEKAIAEGQPQAKIDEIDDDLLKALVAAGDFQRLIDQAEKQSSTTTAAAETTGGATLPASPEPTTPVPAPVTAQGSSQTFEVKGPPGMTFAQAKEIFDKQFNSGSLTGFKPGTVLSAATQASAGLESAIAAIGQQASGIIGSLGSGLSSAVGQIGSLASKAVGSLGSIVDKTVSAVKSALSSPSTNGINTADFAKVGSALGGIGGLNTAEVTGVLAQTKKLVGQAADKLTNTKGVGTFGFDAKQLELAGFLKPGTSALVSQGTSALSSLLKSPSVFTGKEGIKDIGGLLSNPALQSATQQDLMAQGAAGLKSLGIPTPALGAQGSAGLLMSASKSLPNTEAFVKGLPLPDSVKAQISTNIKEGAFATQLTELKIPDAFKEQDIPIPAGDTVNRETLNAAAKRVLGNAKIPTPDFTGSLTGSAAKFESFLYAKVPDKDLVYSGTDHIIWDRINAERLRRGLPGLAEIGYPRPPEEPRAPTAAN